MRTLSQWGCLILDIQSCRLSSVLSTFLSSLRSLMLFIRVQPCCSISHSCTPLLQQLNLVQLQPFTLRVDQFHLPCDLIKHLYMHRPHGDSSRCSSAPVLNEIMCFTMAGLIGSLDPLLLPLVFREVPPCRQAAADATPGFQANLCLSWTQFVFKNIQVIHNWLERAGQNSTLNISIFAPLTPHDDILMQQVLSALTCSSSRWGFLTFKIQSYCLSSVLSGPLSSLRMLTLAGPAMLFHISFFHPPSMIVTHLQPFTLARCTQLLSLTVLAINNPAISQIPFTL